ncbi:MAG: hypothetical protein ABL958_09810, partial [Bdellovibrionia bacterium]
MKILWTVLFLFAQQASALEPSCSGIGEKDFRDIVGLLETERPMVERWHRLSEKVTVAKVRCAQNKNPVCLERLESFVENQRGLREDGHTYRFLLSDTDYVATRAPGVVELPPEFADGLPGDWREICERNGWKYLEYASNLIANPPNLSFKRVLILVPGETFERWIQFTVPEKNTQERLIDIIGVEHSQVEDGKLTELQSVKLNFIEYWRDGEGKNPQVRSKMASCFKCHAGGMRRIVPAGGSVSVAGAEVLKEFNKKIASYESYEFAGAVRPDLGGPAMGDKQRCTNCHDGETRGMFNAHHMGLRSRQQIYHKMVEDLRMPPSIRSKPEYKPLFAALAKADALSDLERADLYGKSYLKVAFEFVLSMLGREKGAVAVSH